MFLAMLAISLSAGALPVRDPDSIGAAIAEAGKGANEIVTPADRALMRAKCGETSDHSINFKNKALVCPDGRRIEDAETRAMSERISARATAYVDRVMNDPKVRRAIDGTAQREAAAALRRAADRLERRERRRRS